MYAASEEYRFFLKKIKYQEELVYEWEDELRDIVEVSSWDSSTGWVSLAWDTQNIKFLDELSADTLPESYKQELPEMQESEERMIQAFSSFELKKLETHTNIFGITTEYPDPYHEWYSAWVSVYVLSTKSYEEVKAIFEVLAFDLPYSINEVDNFGQQSLYINLDETYEDNYVRLVLEHENKAFWLKIRKDRYNEVKWILERL